MYRMVAPTAWCCGWCVHAAVKDAEFAQRYRASERLTLTKRLCMCFCVLMGGFGTEHNEMICIKQ
jgi:hypothetical protein